MKYLKDWLFVNLGIAVMLFVTAVILSADRGAGLYWQEFKEFKGAVSRASGGDYQATREEFIEPEPEKPAHYDVSQLSTEDANDLLEALFARIDIQEAALAPKPRKKG